MRCNKFSLKVAQYLNRDKKPSITFAPEAGSDRLRNVIGKYLSNGLEDNKIIFYDRLTERTRRRYNGDKRINK